MVWQAPVQGGRKGAEEGVSPIIGTMFVFVIIVMGMAGALVFGVPSIQGIQDRAALGDMAGQLEQVREEAEKLTVEGAGAGMVLAPSDGYISLQEGTMMAVTISYDSQSQQQGLSLAWGKGGKRRNQLSTESKQCDVHFQDWADGDQYVTMVMDPTYCQDPMLWDPSDGSTTTSGTSTTQVLGVDNVVTGASAGWATATASTLGTSDNTYATYATNNPGNDQDLTVSLANPSSRAEAITSVVIWAEVSITGASNDAVLLGACLTEASDGGQPCPANNDNDFAGPFVHASDTVVSLDVTTEHPEGDCWSWADVADLEPVIRLDQTGGRDGTWRVDRVWAEVTSSALAADACDDGHGSSGNEDECFDSSANANVACLQGFRMTDAGAVNRIRDLIDCDVASPVAPCPANPDGSFSRQENTFVLSMDLTTADPDDVERFDGDWYFQLSNDPRNAALDTLLAKSFIFEMDQLRWVRDQGLSTWLEGGAVFGTRLDTQYVISQPIIDENFIEAPAGKCDDLDANGAPLGSSALESDDPVCQPTYYLRVIRFEGQDASVAANGGAIDTYLEHVGTFSTANDGVSIMRFDFAGEGAELWCNALDAREPPEGYDYVEHEDFPCDGGAGNAVRSLAYVYHPDCAAAGIDPNTAACAQHQRASRRYYSVVFAEVHFDVKLRP